MIPECGTGNLYLIGSTAAGAGWFDGGGTYVASDNLWVLYQVQQDGPKVGLDLVDYTHKDRSRDSNTRGTGTAFVDEHGYLHAYCHEKVIGDIDNRQEGGQVDFDEYWVDEPDHGGSTSVGGGGKGQPKEQF